MPFRLSRAMLLLGTMAAVPLLLPAVAYAAEAPRAFDIPAQDLSQALVELARQSGRNLLFSPDVVKGRRSAPVAGAKSFESALDTMLSGSGLAGTIAADGSVTITAARLASTLASTGPETAAEIVVNADLYFRNRTNDINPVLAYDYEFFQRFEPLSVGEMMKRLPSITFASDVLEYDAVSVRGLPPGYTQILINGRRAPGGEADRSFYVDRVPAELVERIEIIRSPRADQPSEGVAATLNIITKDSANFTGGFAKVGILINEPDGQVRPTGSLAYAGKISDSTSYWLSGSYQGRRNPKTKITEFYDGDFEEFVGLEEQQDIRDGVDISLNGEITTAIGEGTLRATGLFIDTNRDEDELSLVFEGDDPLNLELDEVEIQRERISQQTYAITLDGKWPLWGGELGLAFGWSGFREDSNSETDEGDIVDEAELVEIETLNIVDDELGGTISYTTQLGGVSLKAGIDFLSKQRNGENLVFEVDGEDISDETPPGSIFTISEMRVDPYVRLTGEFTDGFTFDAGLRYEITSRTVTSDESTAENNAGMANPSFNLRYAFDAQSQLRFSAARTVRRPGYDLISPFTQEESPADEDELVGNPDLRNESSWGIDFGYERRIGGNGVVGLNIFYRDISDVIELVNTGVETEAGGRVYQPQNIGQGQTWGIEFDLSTSLDFIGLPDTGIYANYTWLDSRITDPFTGEDRQFNDQPHHIYNFGFIQNLRDPGVSFGASYSGRSSSTSSNFDETVELTYGGDLEAFIEKRFGTRFVLRFTASNLLDRSKNENFRIYDGDSVAQIVQARIDGDVSESEAESETSGRLFQITLRAAF
jgi:outer membrane receptor for ferrienterochelin and colicins